MSRWKIVQGVLLISSVILLGFAIQRLDIKAVVAALQKAEWEYVPCWAALVATTFALQAWRIRLLVSTAVPLIHYIAANAIGNYAGEVTPSTMMYYPAHIAVLRRNAPEISSWIIISGFLVETTIGATVFMALLLGALLVIPVPNEFEAAAPPLLFITGIFMVVGVVLISGLKLPAQLAHRVPERLLRWSKDVGQAYQRLRSPYQVGWLTAASFTEFMLVALADWALLRAFVPDAPLYTGFLIMCAVAVAGYMPSTPASIGVTQVAMVVALSPLKQICTEEAVAFSFAFQAIRLVLIVGMGNLFLLFEGLQLRDLKELRGS
jgi:uncharacterized membrane protein YbhN (UPF0104 family)